MDTPPSGTVTFLFTDIEGSTLLLERLARHGGAPWTPTTSCCARRSRTPRPAGEHQRRRRVRRLRPSRRRRRRCRWRPASTCRRRLAGGGAPAGADGTPHRRGRTGRPGLRGTRCPSGRAYRRGPHGGQVLLSSATGALAERALPEAPTCATSASTASRTSRVRSGSTSCASTGCPRRSPRPARSMRA